MAKLFFSSPEAEQYQVISYFLSELQNSDLGSRIPDLKPFMRAGLIWFDDFNKQAPFSVLRVHAAQPVVPLQAVSHSSAEPTPCLSPMEPKVRKVSSRVQPDQIDSMGIGENDIGTLKFKIESCPLGFQCEI